MLGPVLIERLHAPYLQIVEAAPTASTRGHVTSARECRADLGLRRADLGLQLSLRRQRAGVPVDVFGHSLVNPYARQQAVERHGKAGTVQSHGRGSRQAQ